MKSLLLALPLALFTTIILRADDPQGEAVFKKLLAAQVAHDYEAFVADGTPQLQAALSKTQFEASCGIIDPKLNAGYDLTSLGELNQKGYQVFLFRLRFKDGDDMLGTLSLKDGKVGGIYFK